MKENFEEVRQAFDEPVDTTPACAAKEEVKSQIDWRARIKEKVSPLLTFKATLPSNSEIIEYNAMNTKDLKRLLLYGSSSDPRIVEDVLDRLISTVVTTPNFNVENLNTYDRTFLLVNIRINSKGGALETTYKCAHCENTVYFVQNLIDFKIKPKPEPECIAHEIIVSDGLILYIDYNTRKDQKELFKFSTAKKEEEIRTEMGLLSMAALIKGISVDGETHMFPEFTYKDRYETFMGMPESVLDKLIKWEKDHAFGVEMKYERTCPHCGSTDTIEIPVSSLF